MSRPLSLGQRAFVRVIDALCIRFLGHPLPFLREVISTHGIRGYRTISGTIQSVLSQCTARFGVVDANLLIGVGAMWNGCHFCSRRAASRW